MKLEAALLIASLTITLGLCSLATRSLTADIREWRVILVDAIRARQEAEELEALVRAAQSVAAREGREETLRILGELPTTSEVTP